MVEKEVLLVKTEHTYYHKSKKRIQVSVSKKKELCVEGCGFGVKPTTKLKF